MLRKHGSWVLPGLLACLPLRAAAPVDFQRQIRPILAKNCFPCHGPDDAARKANFRLDSFEGATGKNGGYPGIVPGSSAKSRVVARITHPKRPMPPVGKRLEPSEVELIRNWIDQGAKYEKHWAFEKPVRPALPAVKERDWPRNEIDYFVLARLEKEGLQPSPEAARYTLARRLALDLTGVPPDPDLVESFAHDKSPDAYEKVVDRLLASPRYGERWARVWLDLARYADTQGYEKDDHRVIWPYRDWVIKAFNDNMPFDRFTILQLAGDLLPSLSQDDLIATGFHRNTMTNTEGGTDDEEFRDAAVKDRVATTGEVWMGMTWGCAQCHSHKYDPITHQDFYQLYAFFNQTEDSDKEDDRPVLKLASASTLVMRELPPERRRITHIQERGSFLSPGAVVQADVPAAFFRMPEGAPHNRLGLAQWLVSPENPLTARVQVNRFWARLFGRGLVESEEDFGTQGVPPTNPELLDWLATEFVRMRWDMKALLKTIVLSATYRQSSDVTPALYERDPYNRLLARGARFRLDAEIVRDQALATSGLLSAKMGGPPVMPWQPDGIWLVVYNGDRWITSPGEDRYRRGIYTFMRRSAPYPSFATYDAPTGEVCTVRRIRTNTPLQALVTLNDPASMEAAQHLALRTLEQAGRSATRRAAQMFRAVLVRPPEKAELKRIVALHRQAADELRGKPEEAEKLLHYSKVLYAEDRQQTLVADARTAAPQWRYTTEDPGAGWEKPDFDAAAWSTGQGQFGYQKPRKNKSDADDDLRIGTPWQTEQIWLRLEFEVPEGKFDHLRFPVRTVSGFELFLNGVPAAASTIDRSGYYEYAPSAEAGATLHPGRNVLAVKATRLRGVTGGQLIDVGLTAARDVEYDTRKHDWKRAAWVVVANTLLNLDEALTRR